MSDTPITSIDLVIRLRTLAGQVDDRPITEIEQALIDAAEMILLLRKLVGIRTEIELEDAEPEGRA
ncbi:hypothetical protein [Labrys neptuniae]